MKLNKFVGKAAEMHASGNLSWEQLKAICGDEETFNQALIESERISQEQLKKEELFHIALILDILED